MNEEIEKLLSKVALNIIESANRGLMPNCRDLKEVTDRINETIRIRESGFYTDGGTGGMSTASQYYTDPNEAFDGWLPLILGIRSQYLVTEGHLNLIRNTSRLLFTTNDIALGILSIYKAFIVGEGVTTVLLPTDLDMSDLEKYVDAAPDKDQVAMVENWKQFWEMNDGTARMDEWVERDMRDGECINVFEKDTEAGVIWKFCDPAMITGQPAGGPPIAGNSCGVKTEPLNMERETALLYNSGSGAPSEIPFERFVHDKRNVDMNITRGIPKFYPSFARFRRIEKLMNNVSVLAQIQSAIALIRKHPVQSGADLNKFASKIAAKSGGGIRSSADGASGIDYLTQQFRRGSIIDTKGFDYEFPAHSVSSENFLNVVHEELAPIGLRANLPVDWLLGKEIDIKLLGPNSVTVTNFRREQRLLYGYGEQTRGKLHEVFYKVQTLMGVSPEVLKKWRVEFYGPQLPTATLDSARIAEIEERGGVLSPQTWASKLGRNWLIERIQMLRHRNTRQDDEVMPGDAGNTNVTGDQKSAGQGGDGTSKKSGTQKGGAK